MAAELANQVEAGHVRHHVVDHEHVDHPPSEQTLRLARPGGGLHFVAVVAERVFESGANLRFVVDEKDRAHAGREERAPRAGTRGSVTDAAVPAGVLAISIRPPRLSMMLRVMARPMPVPVRFVVKNGSKT